MTDKEKIEKLLELVNSIQEQLPQLGCGFSPEHWDLNDPKQFEELGHESSDALTGCCLWYQIEFVKKEIGG